MKIKLVAIAKDEAAYIAEWIFHHLYFGFDEIEVYVNFTTDATDAILEKIENNHPIKFKNAEYLLNPDYNLHDHLLAKDYLDYNRLQSRAYAEALSNARIDGFSHIMFLDIDEFWTPCCFSKDIKEILSSLSDPESASFHWKNKVREFEQFGRPFQADMVYLKKPQVKTITKIGDTIKLINSHYSIHMKPGSNSGTELNKDNIADEENTAYILHRFQRSEMEYISMLGRGDPTSAGKFNLKFTRSGYLSDETSSQLKIKGKIITKYDTAYQEFIASNHIEGDIEAGKKFVYAQKGSVLEYIKENIKTYNIIKKVIPGLTLDDEFINNLNRSKGLNDTQINMLRDIALQLEEKDLTKAYELMKIAYAFKPKGPLIKKKYQQYKTLARAKAQNKE